MLLRKSPEAGINADRRRKIVSRGLKLKTLQRRTTEGQGRTRKEGENRLVKVWWWGGRDRRVSFESPRNLTKELETRPEHVSLGGSFYDPGQTGRRRECE